MMFFANKDKFLHFCDGKPAWTCSEYMGETMVGRNTCRGEDQSLVGGSKVVHQQSNRLHRVSLIGAFTVTIIPFNIRI